MKELILELKSRGHKVILWTCRTGSKLLEAVEHCKNNGIVFDDVNNNKFCTFNQGNKIFFHRVIDDRACGYSYVYSTLTFEGAKGFADLLEKGEV